MARSSFAVVVFALVLPLIGAAVIRLFAPRMKPVAAAIIASGAVGLAHLVSWVALFALLGEPPTERSHDLELYTFFTTGDLKASIALRWDTLSQVMLMIITGIGFLIHLYSAAYMKGDEKYQYFFADLNLFVFSMLLLVLGGNFLLLFAGWELVGLSSYLLIGFWSHKSSAADAGKKAFLVNRIGDAGFIVAILLIITAVGALDYTTVFERAPGAFPMGSGAALALALCLFCGAAGKSAQFPLHVWLPDAMEGPTPVSALIHAATMVTAGVYMVCRCHVIFELAPVALVFIGWVGAFTALLAGSMALAQNDLKRILAYSTVSQLGFMFLGVGVGAYDAAMFHLFTHAFFKALLFLCAGSVMHAMAGELNVWKMGGLRRVLPVTFVTFLIGTLALTGAPLTAGFFSKDELLWRAFMAHPHGLALWGAGLAASLLTGIYSFRALWLVFLGKPRYGANVHPHESPRLMLVPLWILAVGSVVAGYLWLPAALGGFAPFAQFLEPALGGAAHAPDHGAASQQVSAMAAAIAVFVIGLVVASVSYKRGGRLARRVARSSGGLYRVLRDRYYIDEAYAAVIVRPLYSVAGWLERWIDRAGIDRSTERIVGGVVRASEIGRAWQSGRIRHYALAFSLGAALLAILPFIAKLLGVRE